MRESVKDPHRLQHMLEAVDKLLKFLKGKNQTDLIEDDMLLFASAKCIEIIGEAAYKLTKEFRESHPDTHWREIIGMRHILVHGYYQMQAESIYSVYQDDAPALRTQLLAYIEELNRTGF